MKINEYEELSEFELNHDWMTDPENKEQYQGQWVVLCHGNLVAYGTNFTELYRNYGAYANCGNWIVKVE